MASKEVKLGLKVDSTSGQASIKKTSDQLKAMETSAITGAAAMKGGMLATAGGVALVGAATTKALSSMDELKKSAKDFSWVTPADLKAADDLVDKMRKTNKFTEEQLKDIKKQTTYFKQRALASNTLFNSEKKVTTELKKQEKTTKGLKHHLFTLRSYWLAITAAVAVATVTVVKFFSAGFMAVEKFRLSVASAAASITTFSDLSAGNVDEVYANAYKYAGKLALKMEIINARTIASGDQLRAMNDTFIQQGVLLDVNSKKQEDAFVAVANAVSLITQGQNQEIQMRQEIRGLLSGDIRATNLLARMIDVKLGGSLKENIKKWKQQGTLLENLGKHLEGFKAGSADLASTWVALSTTFETIANRYLRQMFKPIYEDIIETSLKFSRSLLNQKEHIEDLTVPTSELYRLWVGMKAITSSMVTIIGTMKGPVVLLVQSLGKSLEGLLGVLIALDLAVERMSLSNISVSDTAALDAQYKMLMNPPDSKIYKEAIADLIKLVKASDFAIKAMSAAQDMLMNPPTSKGFKKAAKEFESLSQTTCKASQAVMKEIKASMLGMMNNLPDTEEYKQAFKKFETLTEGLGRVDGAKYGLGFMDEFSLRYDKMLNQIIPGTGKDEDPKVGSGSTDEGKKKAEKWFETWQEMEKEIQKNIIKLRTDGYQQQVELLQLEITALEDKWGKQEAITEYYYSKMAILNKAQKEKQLEYAIEVSEKEAEVIKAREKLEKDTLESFRTATMTKEELAIDSLDKQFLKYHTFVKDKKALDDWYITEYNKLTATALDKWAASYKKMSEIHDELMITSAESFSSGIVDGFIAVVDGSKSGKEAIRDFAEAYLKEAASMFLKTTLLESMKKLFGKTSETASAKAIAGNIAEGGSVNTLTSSYWRLAAAKAAAGIAGAVGGGVTPTPTPTPSIPSPVVYVAKGGVFNHGSKMMEYAKGAAFNNGRVQAFATGGIVNSPTIFPMKNGMGLMGEAGPEGILPLTRTSTGKLGVESQGGGPTTIIINAIDSKSFEEVVQRNPAGIVNVINDALEDNSALRSTIRNTI